MDMEANIYTITTKFLTYEKMAKHTHHLGSTKQEVKVMNSQEHFFLAGRTNLF